MLCFFVSSNQIPKFSSSVERPWKKRSTSVPWSVSTLQLAPGTLACLTCLKAQSLCRASSSRETLSDGHLSLWMDMELRKGRVFIGRMILASRNHEVTCSRIACSLLKTVSSSLSRDSHVQGHVDLTERVVI